MSDSQEQEIIGFTVRSRSGILLGAALIIVSLAVYFTVPISGSGIVLILSLIFSSAVMGIIMIVMPFYQYARVKRTVALSCLESGGSKMYYDFKNGEKYLGGRMIIGDAYMFFKDSGTIVDCRKIEKVTRKVNRYKGVAVSESVCAQMIGGKKTTLFTVAAAEHSNEEITQAVCAVETHSPNVLNT